MAESNLDPTEADLKLAEDEARREEGLGPLPSTVAELQARIAQLTGEKQKVLAQMDTRTDLDATLATLNSQLREARERLDSVEFQSKSQN